MPQMDELREPFLVCLILSVFLLYCSIVGFALNTLLKPWEALEGVRENMYFRWFFALSSGVMINITVLFIIGIFGIFTIPIVIATGVILFTFSFLFMFYF